VRALVVGPAAKFSTHDVWQGWCRGLAANGVEVVPFELSDRLNFLETAKITDDDGAVLKQLTEAQARSLASFDLLAFAYRYQPDVAFIVHGAHVDWNVLAELRCRVVMVLTESPYEDDAQAAMCQAVEPDLILLNDPTHLGVFGQIAPAYYSPHAYDPDRHHPGMSTYKSDAVFVGTGFPERCEWLLRVDWDGIDLTLAGDWYRLKDTPLRAAVLHGDDMQACADNAQTAELYRGAKAGFNIYRHDAIHGEHSHGDGWAVGPREVEMAACGLWMARQSRPESDDLFPMLPTFSEPEELGDLIRWAIAHPDERRNAADAARAAIADRTFQANAGRALARLDDL
jgi:spore maturation protein CgeB